jgi:hypothetical protein
MPTLWYIVGEQVEITGDVLRTRKIAAKVMVSCALQNFRRAK